jgi:chromosome segregation ATPase
LRGRFVGVCIQAFLTTFITFLYKYPMNMEKEIKNLAGLVEIVTKQTASIVVDLQGVKDDMNGMKKDLQGVRGDLQGVKQDLQGVKEDVSGLKQDMSGLKDDMNGMKKDMNGLKDDVKGVKDEMCAMGEKVDFLAQSTARQFDLIHETFATKDDFEQIRVDLRDFKAEARENFSELNDKFDGSFRRLSEDVDGLSEVVVSNHDKRIQKLEARRLFA